MLPSLLNQPPQQSIEREEVAFLWPPSVHLMNKNHGEALCLFIKCEGITWEAERLLRDNFCNYLRVDFMSYAVVEWMQCRSCHFGIRNPFTISSKANYSCPSELILPCSASQIFFDKYQHEGLTLAHTKQSTLNIHSDCVKTTSGGDDSTKASISKHIAVIQSYPIPLPPPRVYKPQPTQWRGTKQARRRPTEWHISKEYQSGKRHINRSIVG